MKVNWVGHGHDYRAKFNTGKFKGLSDHGEGWLEVVIALGNPSAPNGYKGGAVRILSVDDGVWCAPSPDDKPITPLLVNEIVNTFNNLNGYLTTEIELNKILLPFGLKGSFTG